MDYQNIEIAMVDNIEIEKIHDAVPRRMFKRITLPRDAKSIFITFDLKTTDFSKLLRNNKGYVYIAVISSN